MRNLVSYNDYLRSWDKYEKKVQNHFEKQEMYKHLSLEKSERVRDRKIKERAKVDCLMTQLTKNFKKPISNAIEQQTPKRYLGNNLNQESELVDFKETHEERHDEDEFIMLTEAEKK